MKKLISILLVLALALSFAACNNKDDNTTTSPEQSTLPLDVEQLKNNWTAGVLDFADDKKATVGTNLNEFTQATGLTLGNAQILDQQTIEPGAIKEVYLVSETVKIAITCKNLTDEAIKVTEATVVGYNFSNTHTGNNTIKFANTLTVGVGKADVEEALGKPKKTAGDNRVYLYNGRNKSGKKIQLRIAFNSYDIVNSVAFEIEY